MTDKLPEAPDRPPLPPEDLRWVCDPDSFDFDCTSELDPVREIIGQERALRAITLGLEMRSPGYNIFVSGFVGTGRNTTIQRVLQHLDRGTVPPDDLCYVHNFSKPDRPRALFVPAGKGARLRDGMQRVIRHLGRDIPQIFESEPYRKGKEQIRDRFRTRTRELIQTFEERVGAEGFALVQVQVGPMTNPEVVPVVDGEPKFLTDLEQAVEAGEFPKERLEELREKHREYHGELQEVVKGAMKIDSEMNSAFAEHDRNTIRPLVKHCVDEIREEFTEQSSVLEWIGQVEEHLLTHLAPFTSTDEGEEKGEGSESEGDFPGSGVVEYQVNLVVDHSGTKGAPVVVENTPASAQLFGIIERKWSRGGEETVDHTRIRAGSLHAANGGYLVLNASDLFHEPAFVWNTLKRTLRTGLLEIPISEPFVVLGPPAIKPEPVRICVKVVLIGDAHLYALLYHYDEDFKKIFKVRADFDTEMDNDPENRRLYGCFVQGLVDEEEILPFDRTGVAELVEHGSRLAGRRRKLSTRFHRIADLAREASHFARKENAPRVHFEHVRRAREERDYRHNLSMEKMQDLIREGTIFIDVDGRQVGEVNGLAVYDSGEFSFGIPSKITATVSMGNAGIINIEREADLSGRTHDKGMQILAGFIREKYAQEKPLTLSASVCFEQSYHGVDGDSASSTELYALLSSLSGIPIRQEIAVTGSVNQKGEIQPIGGANEKIEGFYDACAAKGLTGRQGVMVPEANRADLMLYPRVVEAVRNGKFHIYAVATIDEGIEILTGVVAGKKEGRRRYPRDSVNGRVDKRLRELAEQMREYGHP
jgi:lon-related putative ATP-dependent protease